MNEIRKISPHAAILIANMYFVLFGIDRVNTAMNFINNGYTKCLLLVMIACCALIVSDLLARHNRSRGDGRDVQRLVFIGAGALLNAALAIILLTDAILGNRGMPFLSEPVKFVTLFACIANWVNGFRMIAAVRADLRAEQARRAAARRNARRRPAPQPSRSRYGSDSGRSRYEESSGARSRYSGGDYRSSRYESDRYGDSRRSGYAAEDGIRRSSGRYADESASRYGSSGRYGNESASRYGSSGRYADENASRYGGESRARTSGYESGYSRTSRYAESGYSGESRRSARGGDSTRYADGGYDRSAGRSRSGGYDGEVGGISRNSSQSNGYGESARRSSRYSDEY